MINHILQTGTSSEFTTAIAAGASEIETMPGLRGDGQGNIVGIQIESLDNLDWKFELLDQSYNIKADELFRAVDATEYTISGVKKYYYSTTGLSIPIPFEAGYNTVLVAIRNMSSVAKTAGAGGTLKLTLIIEK